MTHRSKLAGKGLRETARPWRSSGRTTLTGKAVGAMTGALGEGVQALRDVASAILSSGAVRAASDTATTAATETATADTQPGGNAAGDAARCRPLNSRC